MAAGDLGVQGRRYQVVSFTRLLSSFCVFYFSLAGAQPFQSFLAAQLPFFQIDAKSFPHQFSHIPAILAHHCLNLLCHF